MRSFVSVVGLGLALGLGGCQDNPADLQFDPPQLDFGSHPLSRPPTSQTRVSRFWTLTNITQATLVIGELSASTMGLAAPLSLGTEGTCVSGAEVGPEASCTIELIFEPLEAGTTEQDVVVSFSKKKDDGALGRAQVTEGSVVAQAQLDCGFEPDHPLCGEDDDLKFEPSPLQFGSVDLFSSKTMTVTVRNSDTDEAAILGAVLDDATLGLPESYTLDPVGTTCQPSQVLAANGGSCVLSIIFQPQVATYLSATLHLPFREEHQADLVENASLFLQGTGVLNCSVTPELATARADGVTAARTRNQQESAAGTAAGQALTYGQGVTQGYVDTFQPAYDRAYAIAYDAAYDTAYASSYASAYTSAYNNAYDDRYDELVNDSSICSRGYSYGRSDGTAAGRQDGEAEGYADGYEEYASSGYYDGYDWGYEDGANACVDGSEAAPGSHRAGKRKAPIAGSVAALIAPTDPQFEQACYQQGYNATYDSGSYRRAYLAAAAANVQFQNGIRAGRTSGTNDGTASGSQAGDSAGRSDGNAQGTQRGRSDGFARGEYDAEGDAQPVIDAIYSRCYLDGYDDYYISTYESAYESAYIEGADDGYDDSYDDGYYVGYDDGYYDYCGSASDSREGSSSRAKDVLSATELRALAESRAARQQKSVAPRWLIDIIGAEEAAEFERSRGIDTDGTVVRERMRQSMRERAIRTR